MPGRGSNNWPDPFDNPHLFHNCFEQGRPSENLRVVGRSFNNVWVAVYLLVKGVH